MILFECMKKACVESAAATIYEVWFREHGRKHNNPKPGQMGEDTDWKRYEVDKDQFAVLKVGQSYQLAVVPPQ